jgi:hypothetical protein
MSVTPAGISLPGDDGVGSKVPSYNLAFQILESLINGTNAKDLAARTTAYTLTATEARNRIHRFTNAGAALDIKLPLANTANRITVYNNSGFTLTIKTDAVGSTGVAVLNTKTQELFINGNNVQAAAAAV